MNLNKLYSNNYEVYFSFFIAFKELAKKLIINSLGRYKNEGVNPLVNIISFLEK